MLGWCWVAYGIRGHRQFDNKPCADGVVLFYTNGAMVVFNNPIHNGQAEAGTALLGRKIWKKEFFEDGEVWVDGEWDSNVLKQQ